MEHCTAVLYLRHKRLVTYLVVAHKGAAVLEHRLRRLLSIVKAVITLAQVVLNNEDLRPERGQGLAVLRLVHAEGAGKLLCHADCLRIGSVHRRQPLAKQGNLLTALQRLHVRLKLTIKNSLCGTAGRSVQQDKNVIPTAVLRYIGQISYQRRHLVLSQPADQRTEHGTLTQAAPDITGIEENLHSHIRILGKGPQKTILDLRTAAGTQGTDGREQIQAVRTGAAGRHCAILRYCHICGLFHCLQKIQHNILSSFPFIYPGTLLTPRMTPARFELAFSG